jgi:hypothetical protein
LGHGSARSERASPTNGRARHPFCEAAGYGKGRFLIEWVLAFGNRFRASSITFLFALIEGTRVGVPRR